MTIGLALLSWIFLIEPYAHDTTIHPGTKLISIGYPLGDILIMGVAVRMAVGAGRRDPAYCLMIGALAALLGTDAVYGWIQHVPTPRVISSTAAGFSTTCSWARPRCIRRWRPSRR